MKLCVLMPAYNEERFIESAILSIFAGTEKLEISLIVVDDGSTDNTANVVRDLCKSNPEIQLFSQKNRGITETRNALLAAIPDTCDLVTFLDADDAFSPGWLVNQCARLAQDPALALAYGHLCTIESDVQDLAIQSKTDSLICRSISLSCGIYRPWLLEKTGEFDMEFEQAEDMDYLLRIFEAGPNVHLSDDIAVLYRQHSGNVTRASSTVKRSFARAVLRHIMRRKRNPELVSVEGIFTITQMTEKLKAQRR